MPRGKLLNQPIMGNALNKPGDAGGTDMIHELGSLAEVWDSTNGHQIWRYVYNDEASTGFVQGNVLAYDTATSPNLGDVIVAPVSTPRNRVAGVAQTAIAAGSYGWVLVKGLGEVKAGTGTIDVDEGIYVDKTDAGTAMQEGVAVTDANSAITAAHLAGPIGYATEDANAAALATCNLDCPL